MKEGRPTKYDVKYCEEIVKFFDVPHVIEKPRSTFDKNGNEHIYYEEVPNTLPTFERFAVNIGVNADTVVEWAKVHEDFSAAYKQAKNLQKEMLIDLGTRGLYNATFTIFTAKNITDMKDKTENESSGELKLIVETNRHASKPKPKA